MAVITVVGAGQMGSALAFPLSENGHEVRLVGTALDREIISRARVDNFHINLKRTLPKGTKHFNVEEMGEALKGVDLIIGGVSSFGVDWFREEAIPCFPKEIPVLSVTKGMIDLPDGEFITYPQYYQETYPDRKFYAIGGPCTSYELADRDQTEVCFCGPELSILKFMKSLLGTDYYHISISTDVTGVECAVAMKNAYALAVTLAVGLSEKHDGKEHYNSQAALFGQSVREMQKLLRLIGGGDDKIMLGAGDLYVTVFGGRTRRIGTLLGKGLSFDEAMKALEGVTLESIVIAKRTARAIRRRIEKGEISASDFPLLLHVDDIIQNGAPVNIPWNAFETEDQ